MTRKLDEGPVKFSRLGSDLRKQVYRGTKLSANVESFCAKFSTELDRTYVLC